MMAHCQIGTKNTKGVRGRGLPKQAKCEILTWIMTIVAGFLLALTILILTLSRRINGRTRHWDIQPGSGWLPERENQFPHQLSSTIHYGEGWSALQVSGKVNYSEVPLNRKNQLILSIDSECTGLGNEILRDGHVYAALLSVSRVLDTTKWYLCRRRIASILCPTVSATQASSKNRTI